MLDANIHQEKNRIHAPSAYDEMFHAVGIAAYIQGIYTNTESLLKQALEITDGKIPKGDSWHQDLIRLAGIRIDGVRVAFLDAEGMKSMRQALAFRHVVRSNYGDQLQPQRVFEQIPVTVAAVDSVAEGIRQVFFPAPAPPVERGG